MKENPISKVEQTKPAREAESKSGSGTPSSRWWWILALILFGLIGGYIYYNHNAANDSKNGGAAKAGKKGALEAARR